MAETKIRQAYKLADFAREICAEQRASGIFIKVKSNKNGGYIIALKDLRNDAMRERVKAEVNRLLGGVLTLAEEKQHALIYELK